MNALGVDIHRKVFSSPNGGEFLALSQLKFEVPRGQFCCIIGPSGSGKTTFLNIVSGLDAAYEGEVRIAGQAPGAGPRLGYMFQSPRLMPWLTVEKNVALVATHRAIAQGMPRKLLEQVGLGASIDAYPNRLSGGMQRRVALARAFVNEPPLLLLDEPFISLDAPVANRLRDLLLDQWRARGATIVFVTHDLREALQLGDRLLFMSASPGRVVLDIPVPLDRPRQPEGREVEQFRAQLLAEHPALLAGLEASRLAEGESVKRVAAGAA
jgi:NitT/TauT family transport system ATP-binding protein